MCTGAESSLEQIAQSYTAAWNSGRAREVARHFCEDGHIVINAGEPWLGRPGIAAMADGFFAEVPDLKLVCDGIRQSAGHVLFLWTFTGTHIAFGKPVRVSGWEEWDLDDSGMVRQSRGWFDAEDYAYQAGI